MTDARSGTPDRARAHLAPRVAIVWSVLSAELARQAREGTPALAVLDVGGGSGVFAVPLAELGHRVSVVDPSADALATLERRASEAGVAGGIVAIQGDVDQLTDAVATRQFDLVLCHRVLEVVDDPGAAITTLAGVMRPGGRLSVLAANRVATVIARALGGHPAEALHALADPAGRWSGADPIPRRFDTTSLIALLAHAGLRVERLHGAGVVADLLPGSVLDSAPDATETMRDLELTVAGRSPYRDMATHLHALAGLSVPAAVSTSSAAGTVDTDLML